MATSAILFPIAAFFFFLLNLPNNLDAAGFSVDLIHRDSPKSPFYNHSESLFDRVSREIHRSNSHVNNFIPSTSTATRKDVFSTVVPSSWSYLMTISLGTPPLDILAVMDTGSNLIWTQCLPCKPCYKQVVPLFDPSKSSTYKEISCKSFTCVNISQGCNSNGSCEYRYFYGEYETYTHGVLARETFRMNSSGRASGHLSIPNITFGCGHDNNGTFFSRSQAAGVVGLGRGPFSLISQLGSSVDKKFAHCLVPHDQNTSTSRLDFGDSAVVSGNGTFYTPLISKSGWKDYFYYVNLKTISVGDKNISFPSYLNGNILLDSVMTLTYLPTWAYRALLKVLKGAIHLQPVPSNSLELCYEFGKDFKVPDVTFEFDGGEVVLGTLNTLIKINETVSCFAFWYSDPVGIFGNLAQQNIKIGYDLQNMKVAFKPTDCAHQ